MIVCQSPRIELIQGDCMKAMENMKENQYDLAIVDPPYFSGPEKRGYYGKKESSNRVKRVNYKIIKNSWEIPQNSFYQLLNTVSKNQIIWGINYFEFNPGPGRIVWDKVNGSSSFSDSEIAYCSLHKSTRNFEFMWNGMMQGKGVLSGKTQQPIKSLNEKRIHPTQKPVALYKWLLKNYAKPADTMLDTHGGSMSIAIACFEMGFDLTLYELDEDYYKDGVKRVVNHIKNNQSLFTPKENYNLGNQLEI